MQYSFINTYLSTKASGFQLPTYNVEDIVLTLYKIDAAGGGQISANLRAAKPFAYDQLIVNAEQPNAAYLWLPPDGGAIAHEAISGAAMTIAGAGSGLVGGNGGATRYAGSYGMLSPTNSATLTGAGAFLQAAEDSGQSWTLEFWIFRAATSALAGIYIEANAGVTVYLLVVISAVGVISIQHSGVTAWTAPAAITAGAWHHVMLTYNAGGATIQMFVDGVSAGAASAYTRVGTWPGGNVIWNSSLNGQHFLALGAVYQNLLGTADMANRHFQDLTTDGWPGASVTTGATIAAGFATGVIFSNTVTPGWDSTSQTLRQVLGPVVQIVTDFGVYYCQGMIRWKEGR